VAGNQKDAGSIPAASSLRIRLRAIRDEAREEAARSELAEIKQRLLPEAAATASPAAHRQVPVAAV